MNPPTDLYTAAQIAKALGCSKQNVFQLLRGTPDDGQLVVSGNEAKAWSISSLPPSILGRLSVKAELKRYRSVPALLSEPPQRYEPSVPFAKASPPACEKAFKLQRALRPLIELRNNQDASAADFVNRGLAEYRRVFGHSISAKHWRDLFDRTIERDNGSEEWDRPEIYLDENAGRVSSTRPVSIARERGLEVLQDAMASVAGSPQLSVQQKQYVWIKACDETQLQSENGAAAKKTKRAILKVLISSGLFGADKETVRRNFNRKWDQYRANDGRLTDGRVGPRKDPLIGDDLKLITAKCLDYDGCVEQGWRDANQSGELSAETHMRYATNVRKVPTRIRREVTPLVRSLLPLHKGERAFRHSGPYIQGDYSSLYALDVIEEDDGTPEVVCFSKTADYPGHRIIQGQIIAVVDRATGRALGFGYVEDAYHARVIKSTTTRACIDFGIPKRLNVERGLWKRARMIVGRKTGIVSLDEWEMGLREFMLISHARGPQGKAIVERFFKFIWDRMRPLPGYCGPDMRKTCPELLARQIREARAGKVDPSTFCLPKEKLLDAIAAAMADYNSTQQQGRLCGLSPNEAWDRMQPPDGVTKVTSEIAHLLVHHREPHKIRRRQVLRRVGKNDYIYHSDVTARWDQRTVLLWSNPDDLSMVHVSSLDRKEGPFAIPLVKCCSYNAEPDGEAIRRAQREIDQTNASKRAEYRSIQPFLSSTRWRATICDQATVAVGERLDQSTTSLKKVMSAEATQQRTAERHAKRAGINVIIDAKNAHRKAAAAQLAEEALSEEDAQSE